MEFVKRWAGTTFLVMLIVWAWAAGSAPYRDYADETPFWLTVFSPVFALMWLKGREWLDAPQHDRTKN